MRILIVVSLLFSAICISHSADVDPRKDTQWIVSLLAEDECQVYKKCESSDDRLTPCGKILLPHLDVWGFGKCENEEMIKEMQQDCEKVEAKIPLEKCVRFEKNEIQSGFLKAEHKPFDPRIQNYYINAEAYEKIYGSLNNPRVSSPLTSRVYILGSGISRFPSNILGNLAPPAEHFATFFANAECGSQVETCDTHGSGTHSATLVVDPNRGMNPNAILHAVKVFNTDHTFPPSVIFSIMSTLQGLDWVMGECANRNEACTVHYPIATPDSPSGQINLAFYGAFILGIHVVVANGENTDLNCARAPASSQEALTVGGYTGGNAPIPLSNYGSCLNFYAPGEQISSGWISGLSNWVTSSSAASALTAGVVSSLAGHSQNLVKNPLAVKQILQNSVLQGPSLPGPNGYKMRACQNMVTTPCTHPILSSSYSTGWISLCVIGVVSLGLISKFLFFRSAEKTKKKAD